MRKKKWKKENERERKNERKTTNLILDSEQAKNQVCTIKGLLFLRIIFLIVYLS